jgi:hypothetical protein
MQKDLVTFEYNPFLQEYVAYWTDGDVYLFGQGYYKFTAVINLIWRTFHI